MAHSSAASAHPHPYGVRYHAPVYSEFEILCLCNAVEQLRPSTAADWAMVASDHAVAFDHDGHPRNANSLVQKWRKLHRDCLALVAAYPDATAATAANIPEATYMHRVVDIQAGIQPTTANSTRTTTNHTTTNAASASRSSSTNNGGAAAGGGGGRTNPNDDDDEDDRRNGRFGEDELHGLCDTVDQVRPNSYSDWEEVARVHAVAFPNRDGYGIPRCSDRLYRKWIKLHRRSMAFASSFRGWQWPEASSLVIRVLDIQRRIAWTGGASQRNNSNANNIMVDRPVVVGVALQQLQQQQTEVRIRTDERRRYESLLRIREEYHARELEQERNRHNQELEREQNRHDQEMDQAVRISERNLISHQQSVISLLGSMATLASRR